MNATHAVHSERLSDCPAVPRECALDFRQSAFLLQLLIANDPLHLHFEAPLWTPQALTEVVNDEFDCRLAGTDLDRALFELGLLPSDPLLRLDAERRNSYSHWIANELPRRIALGQVPWWVSENTLPIDDLAQQSTAAAPNRLRSATVIAAINGAGQLAWWFCRGAADTRARVEFVSRLQRLSPNCALLACGLEALYEPVAARLPPSTVGSLLLDPRDQPNAVGANDAQGLFRHQVFAARQRRIEGEVLVLQPLSLRLFSAGVLVLLILLSLFACFGHYARTQNASGVLMPATGVVRLEAPRAGVLQSLQAAVGDRVRAGQPLARIESAQIDADGTQVDGRIVEQLEQSLADLGGEENALRGQGELEQQRLLASLAAALRQHDDLSQQYALQVQRQQLLEDNLARSRKLADSGVIARVQLQELEQQALNGKVQTLALSRERSTAAAASAEARNRLSQQPLDAAQRIDALRQRRAEIAQRLAQARLVAGATLRAPSDGRVAALLAQPGSQLVAGTPLLVLVNDRSRLLAELYLPSRAIGFIRVGQPVQLKLDAFPYQQYGYLGGTVSEVSSAALAPRDLDLQQAGNEALYLVRVALSAQTVKAYGELRSLNAGMQVQADIVIDRPRIVDWLLQPLYALRGH